MNAGRQLVLPVGLRDDSTLGSFLASANAEALEAVRSLLKGDQPFVYLCGEEGTGRTHLLEAAIAAASAAGRPVAYVCLGDKEEAPGPEILQGLSSRGALVCLDDIDDIAGDSAWEAAVFYLFNELRLFGGSLLVAAGSAPAKGGWGLPDLASRLGSGLMVAMSPLDDDERLAILIFRAQRRGFDLPVETGRYLLARVSRRLDDLLALLGSLERATLEHQRLLTVPFVRQLLQREQES